MTGQTATFAPQRTARITAVLFLLTILAGLYAQMFVSNRLIVWDDAAATATNIMGNRSLYQLGFTIYMLEMACQAAMTVLFYVLLKPVDRSVALISMCLGLLGCVIKTMGRLFYLSPLFILDDARYLTVFAPEQVRSLTLLLLGLNDHAAAMGLAFFGLQGVLKGWLILRSTFWPRFLGAVTLISGVGWLAFLSPSLGYQAFPIVALVGLLASAVTIFWLLVHGVNEQRWKEQAIAAGG